MTFDQLIEWAKSKGRTVDDMVWWFALSECQSIRDLDDKELTEMLVQGIKYDSEHVKDVFEGLEPQDQKDYMRYMEDFWLGQ